MIFYQNYASTFSVFALLSVFVAFADVALTVSALAFTSVLASAFTYVPASAFVSVFADCIAIFVISTFVNGCL